MKIYRTFIHFLVVSLLLFLCLNTSPAHSNVSPALSTPPQKVSEPLLTLNNPPRIEPIPTPIGPVETLPGSTIVRITNPVDTSYIAKTGGLVLIISGIARDKYTNVYWGPYDLQAIRHSLSGSLTTDRVLVYDPLYANLPVGSAYWFGSSPSIYAAGLTGTQFRLLSNTSMALASDMGISTTDVVLPVESTSFSVNLRFDTQVGPTTYVPSNDFFNAFTPKSSTLTGSILSSMHDAFWYTAPDVGIEIQSSSTILCINNMSQINVIATNHGPGPATQILVTGLLPTNWEFVSYDSSPCGYSECFNPTTGEWTVGDLADGAQSTLTLTIKVVSYGPVMLKEAKSQYQVDPVDANDSTSQSFDSCYCSFMPAIIR